MNFGIIASRAKQILTDNSPAILTAVTVTGSLATTYLVGKASFKAAEIIRVESDAKYVQVLKETEGAVREKSDKTWEERAAEAFTTQDKVNAVWKLYVPAAVALGLTITSAVCANHIGTRRAAALATAYSLSEKAYTQYKEKVIETIGKKKEQTVRDQVAQDQVTKANIPTSIVIDGSNALCFDTRTGREFVSSMVDLQRAKNEINHKLNSEFYASLTDWYNLIGLDATDESDEVGWTSTDLLDLEISGTVSNDRPCLAVSFRVKPRPNYDRVY